MMRLKNNVEPTLVNLVEVSNQEAPMFARVKKSGKYQYLQIVENNEVKGKVK